MFWLMDGLYVVRNKVKVLVEDSIVLHVKGVEIENKNA